LGSRANLVVVSDAGVELYYDHWGAQGLTYDLVLDGADESLARIRSMSSRDATAPGDWLDDFWAEGGAVLDLRVQQIRWFDLAFEGMRPRLAGHLLERSWPGWTSIWSPEGLRGFFPIDGLAEVEGVVRSPGGRVRSRPIEDLRHMAVAETADSARGHVTADSVLSVRGEDGVVRSIAVGVMLDVVSELRAEWVVDYVSRECGRAGLRGARQGAVDGFSGGWAPDGQGGAWIHQGMLVDLPSRRVAWWSQGSEAGLTSSFAINWPGFTVETWGDDHERHEREAGIAGVQPPLTLMLREERELLWWAAERRVEEDPVASGVASARGAHRVAVMEALDDLITTGVEALPPVRYVDSHGVVVEPAGLDPHVGGGLLVGGE
jgi:hypothetical protein